MSLGLRQDMAEVIGYVRLQDVIVIWRLREVTRCYSDNEVT